MKEIRLHGRGGQGVVIASEMLAAAFIAERKYATAFPMFGGERRGAPVAAFVRFDDRPIRQKCRIYTPDCLLVLDPFLVASPAILSGIKPGSTLILNASILPEKRLHENVDLIGVVDATQIALEKIGIPATNTCMLGAFAATTGWVELSSVITSLEHYFKGETLDKNRSSAESGFLGVKVRHW